MLTSGLKPNTLEANLQLRARMLGKYLALAGAVAAINYLAWKRVDGDGDTPFLAIKTGEKDGKTKYIDAGNLIGPVRGLRQTGALAYIEGARRGDSAVKVKDKAIEDIWHSLLHPLAGPGVQFLHTGLTGMNAMGMKVARTPEQGGTKAGENWLAAMKNANPAYAAMSASDVPEKRDVPAEERSWKLAGPFGIKSKEQVPVEVGNFYDAWHDIQERHKPAALKKKEGLDSGGFDFNAYKRREEYAEKIGKLGAELRGEKPGGKGELPTEERRKWLRSEQARLAKIALSPPIRR